MESIEIDDLESPKAKTKASRRRRRSSARFLRLTGRLMDDIEEDEEERTLESEQQLSDMYRKAVELNAANRINASNSWNLHLVENIDEFLEADTENVPRAIRNTSLGAGDSDNKENTTVDGPSPKRVNFTKASCTLDASVKIYSYRVDDVHLSSYKVLANLNRTDSTNKHQPARKAKSQDIATDSTMDNNKPSIDNEVETIATNVGAINASRLDSAFDIDPLFHKMSKTFDEGGAKGLLLVNLEIGGDGCNIVFDSNDIECFNETPKSDQVLDSKPVDLIEISSLTSQLDTVIADQGSIQSLSLAPQLTALRAQYTELDTEGFVQVEKSSSKRYASSVEDEKEADVSIHHDALERSRASQNGLGLSFASNSDEEASNTISASDRDDEEEFDAFFSMNDDDDGDGIFSASFRSSFGDDAERRSQTNMLLDAICSNNVLKNSQYEYVDLRALEKTLVGNLWAGAMHWKRSRAISTKSNVVTSKEKQQQQKSCTSKRMYVNVLSQPVEDDILIRPLVLAKKSADPLQLLKSTIGKHTKNYHLLPLDVGIDINNLAALFMKPTLVSKAISDNERAKTVGFRASVETFGPHTHDDDNSYGGDDDSGMGYSQCDDSGIRFSIEELNEARKVEKVEVTYATTAKKVDVKKLKRDIWEEIESTLDSQKSQSGDEEELTLFQPGSQELATPDQTSIATLTEGMSFKEAVKDLESHKTQADVTLPFYFICVLHLANEKSLRLDSNGLEDFLISNQAH